MTKSDEHEKKTHWKRGFTKRASRKVRHLLEHLRGHHHHRRQATDDADLIADDPSSMTSADTMDSKSYEDDDYDDNTLENGDQSYRRRDSSSSTTHDSKFSDDQRLLFSEKVHDLHESPVVSEQQIQPRTYHSHSTISSVDEISQAAQEYQSEKKADTLQHSQKSLLQPSSPTTTTTTTTTIATKDNKSNDTATSLSNTDPESTAAPTIETKDVPMSGVLASRHTYANIVTELSPPMSPASCLTANSDSNHSLAHEYPNGETVQSGMFRSTNYTGNDAVTEQHCQDRPDDKKLVISKRLAYFDKQHRGKISMLDTFISLRGLGYHWAFAVPATLLVHLGLSPLTTPYQFPFLYRSLKDWFTLPIYTERVAQALAYHTPCNDQENVNKWIDVYGRNMGDVRGLAFWDGFRALRATEKTTLRWWQLSLWLQWFLTYTIFHDPTTRMITKPAIESLCYQRDIVK